MGMANEEIKRKNVDLALQTAAELFIDHGIENTTREMIARTSGLSRKSIERYFPSKASYTVQAAEWLGRQLRQEVRPFSESMLSAHTAAELLAFYLDDLKQLCLRRPRVFIFFTELKAFIYRNSEDSERDFTRFMDAAGYRKLLERIFRKGAEDGTIEHHADSIAEANYLSNTLISSFSTAVLLYDVRPDRMERFLDQYIADTIHLYCDSGTDRRLLNPI
jgi:AcrR family transcriptional regulator